MSIPKTNRDLAKQMIFPYVTRGETIYQLKASHMGMGATGYHCMIGGYSNNKYYSTDYVITEINDVVQIFSLIELIDEIKNNVNQLTMF